MLVLSRKLGEKIVIGDQVTVTIVRLQGGRVALGIHAPDDVRVLRSEVFEQQFEDEWALVPPEAAV